MPTVISKYPIRLNYFLMTLPQCSGMVARTYHVLYAFKVTLCTLGLKGEKIKCDFISKVTFVLNVFEVTKSKVALCCVFSLLLHL